jgi:replicative superfamily II helicase
MLCILHELGLHRRTDGSIDTGAFKIVYVAPMKALVAEMVGNFTKRLGEAYGLTVRELTGAEISNVAALPRLTRPHDCTNAVCPNWDDAYA